MLAYLLPPEYNLLLLIFNTSFLLFSFSSFTYYYYYYIYINIYIYWGVTSTTSNTVFLTLKQIQEQTANTMCG